MAYIIYNRGDFIIATVFFLRTLVLKKSVHQEISVAIFFAVKQKALADNSRDDSSNKNSLFFKIFPLFFQIFETFF